MLKDRITTAILWSSGSLAALLLVIIIGFTLKEAAPFFNATSLTQLSHSDTWTPSANQWNLWPMAVSSLFLGLGAIVLATPIGICTAVSLRYMLPRPAAVTLRRGLEVAAGIPTVIFGFWGVVTIVPIIKTIQQPGASLLAGIVILTLMIIPTLILLCDQAFAALPKHYRQSARALGIHPLNAAWVIMLPAARRGISIGVALSLARALGETITVVLVCGNIVQIPGNVFEPVRALTANIALEMDYALDAHRAALFASGLLLTLLTGALAVTAGRFEYRRDH